MRALASAMPAFVRMSLQTMIQYRGEMVLWAVWGVVYPAVAMAMWSAAIKGSQSGEQIGDYGRGEFAAYFMITMIIGHLTTAWDVYDMGWQVRSGRMSSKLLRPILPIWQSIADNIAYKVVTMAILLPIWLGVAWIAQPTFTTNVAGLLWGVPAALLAAMLNFLLGYNLALLAFWITRTDAVGQLWFGLSLFFGGRIAPLTILPEPLQWAAAVMPFKWTIWFPTGVLTSRFTPDEILKGIGAQLGWLIVAVILFRFLWHRAVRQYTAVGA